MPRGVSQATAIYAKRAKNAEIWSEDGKRYIDFGAGIAVVNTGHQHPRIMAAVEEQMKAFSHVCFQVTPYESYVRLAERLNALAPVMGPAKTMLISTGAEAVENAVKVARAFTEPPRHRFVQRRLPRPHAHGNGADRQGRSLQEGVRAIPRRRLQCCVPQHLPWGFSGEESLAALKALFKYTADPSSIAAIIIEPVQGEGGFYIAPFDFLRALRALCDEHGILLIADEIQTGFARTGKMFGLEHSGVKADVVTMAKGLAGGFPLSAITGRADVMDASNPGGLGGTYAGNPIACAAAHAVLDVIEDEKLCDRSNAIGKIILDRCDKVKSSNLNCVGDVRGLGAMCAIELVKDAASAEPAPQLTQALMKVANENGLILLSCGTYGNVVRFLVPLTASDALVREGMDIFEASLTEAVTRVA